MLAGTPIGVPRMMSAALGGGPLEGALPPPPPPPPPSGESGSPGPPPVPFTFGMMV